MVLDPRCVCRRKGGKKVDSAEGGNGSKLRVSLPKGQRHSSISADRASLEEGRRRRRAAHDVVPCSPLFWHSFATSDELSLSLSPPSAIDRPLFAWPLML